MKEKERLKEEARKVREDHFFNYISGKSYLFSKNDSNQILDNY